MTKMKTWHKVAFIGAGLLVLASWVIATMYWDKLPQVIPTHFGISGAADSWDNKSIWYVFMLPVLQILMLTSFVFLYYKPQFSDMPTTLWLMTMDKKIRDDAFGLIRTMLVGTSLWIGALFTYLTYAINQSALDGSGPIPWLMLVLIGGMLVWLIWWTIKVYRATRAAIKGYKPKN
jgi:uncharacterized membrane protein